MLGMPAPLERKNCWTIAEQRTHGTPHGFQHLLGRAMWDAAPPPTDIINLTVNEFRRLFDADLLDHQPSVTALPSWSNWRRRHLVGIAPAPTADYSAPTASSTSSLTSKLA